MIICDTHCDTLYMRALQPNKTPCVTMDAMKMIVNALTRKSFAFSHMWMTTDLALGRR